MRLRNPYKNEFGQIEGTALFPYFGSEINVICRQGVSPEYAEKCLGYLEKVDESLILQICRYAEYFLRDTLENTSVGELYYGEGEPFPHDDLKGMLRYFRFGTLYIDKPPADAADPAETEVLNLSGSCDWWEDEGLQCLVRDGKVIYLGYFGALSVWGDHSEDYIGNYALYERRDELRRKAAERAAKMTAEKGQDGWRTQRFVRWRFWGLDVVHRLERLADERIAPGENVDGEEATRRLEGTYFFQLMKEYPELREESIDFWYECYCIEKEQDEGKLMEHICENCRWDVF